MSDQLDPAEVEPSHCRTCLRPTSECGSLGMKSDQCQRCWMHDDSRMAAVMAALAEQKRDLQNVESERKPAETKGEARSPNQIGWVQCHCGSAAAPGEKCPVCGCVVELAKIMASAPTGRE